ncbi:MAG: 4,5-DOPA dioxygenase extradiol [Acidimicrobiales bacterium]|nr:4,5-DOPA dioxygenase extradiol [Acidimicrobiales bacterium]
MTENSGISQDNLMPSVFIGHGNPMFVLEPNRWTEAWSEFFLSIPKPKAILAVSAHWFTTMSAVTVMDHPRTIHDFGGFPGELYRIQYEAPGSKALGSRVIELLGDTPVESDNKWGLDHGTWSVLVHTFKEADVPVVQLSIDATKPPDFHWKLGEMLTPLRSEGVLILGSGNIVHNLGLARFDIGFDHPYDWNEKFDLEVKAAVKDFDKSYLVNYLELPHGKLSAPTPDHYYPLLYNMGAGSRSDKVVTICEGYDAGSLSMRSFALV